MPQMPGFPFTPFGFGGQPGSMFGGFHGRGQIFPRDSPLQQGPQPGEFQDLLSMLFQTIHQIPAGQPRRPNDRSGDGPSNPFELLAAILNPGMNGRHGDMVFSQEAFDRIVEQLAEQNGQSTAPGPASENAIKSLKTKKVDQDMIGSDGTAECSICMDNVEIGSDVTLLPCNHWFHGDCVVAWLKEHDTCPHCRQPITKPEDRPPGESRRRSSRRSSSVASPYRTEGTRDNPFVFPESPSSLRERRQMYYGGRQGNEDPPEQARRYSSSRHERQSQSRQNSDGGSGGAGGVTGRIRNWMGL
jgi:E3 ubiquitin-protein ligase RNF115/126